MNLDDPLLIYGAFVAAWELHGEQSCHRKWWWLPKRIDRVSDGDNVYSASYCTHKVFDEMRERKIIKNTLIK